jgi:hypothetical protein
VVGGAGASIHKPDKHLSGRRDAMASIKILSDNCPI